jgi:hypothetical protein
MAVTQLERDTLSKSFVICKDLLNTLHPRLAQMQTIYDSGGGVKETLSQDDLNSLPELSGLTKKQVDDALYIMTTQLLPVLNSGQTQLAHLAARTL